MYKVFVNDCQLILTDDNNISTNLKKVSYNAASVIEVVENLFLNEIPGICFLSTNLKEDWKNFNEQFKVQKAAGGKVLNLKNEILFIYRFNKWDLPKGKLEKNESIEECAIREVEEECGVSNLQIERQLETTYHIFKRNEKTILKVTYWYLMKTNYSGELIPQTAEGIEKVCFKNQQETALALTNSYKNILLLFN